MESVSESVLNVSHEGIDKELSDLIELTNILPSDQANENVDQYNYYVGDQNYKWSSPKIDLSTTNFPNVCTWLEQMLTEQNVEGNLANECIEEVNDLWKKCTQ